MNIFLAKELYSLEAIITAQKQYIDSITVMFKEETVSHFCIELQCKKSDSDIFIPSFINSVLEYSC